MWTNCVCSQHLTRLILINTLTFHWPWSSYWQQIMLSLNLGLVQLILVHSCSAHIVPVVYGSPLWDLSSSDINAQYVTWRKCVRKIWNVSPRTHCRLLRHLVESIGVQYDLMSRFLSFYDSSSKSNNKDTRFCSLLCKSSRFAVA